MNDNLENVIKESLEKVKTEQMQNYSSKNFLWAGLDGKIEMLSSIANDDKLHLCKELIKEIEDTKIIIKGKLNANVGLKK